MKIAIFTDYYLPSLGGVQTAISQQKKALEAEGHEVIIVTVNYPEWRKHSDFILLPSPLRIKKGTFVMRGFVPTPSSEQLVIKKLRKWGVEVIHVETELSVGGLACRVSKRLDIPCVYTAHTLLWLQTEERSVEQLGLLTELTQLGMIVYMPGKRLKVQKLPGESRVHYTFRKLVISYADYATIVASPSQHLRDKLLNWGVQTPIALMPNFCDIKPKRLPLPEIPTFMWSGRMDPEKRPLDFVNAVEDLEKLCKPDSFRVIMVGEGEQLAEVKKRIGKKPWLDHIGPVPYSDVSAYFERSSVLVMTSRNFDNQPMVIAEAVMHGRGVVLVDKNLQEGLSGGAGFWTNGEATIDLVASLRAIVENPKLAEDMSQAAWANRNIFMAEHGVKELEKVYRRAIRLHEHTRSYRK